MNWFESFRRYALGRSPVRDNKIMCRAGGHTYKDNFKKALLVMLSIGFMAGKVISDFIGDASFSDVSGFIGGFIGIFIGFYIGNKIRVCFSVRFDDFVGFFLGNLIGGVIGGVIVVGGVYIGILISIYIGIYIGNSVIDDATKDYIFRGLLIISLICAVCRSTGYYKWRLGYLGELAVANELHKVKSQQRQIFHGFTYKHSSMRKFLQWIAAKISCDLIGEGGGIDHIIVCRKGVFCVETKTERKNNNNGDTTNNDDTIVFDGCEIYINKTQEILLKHKQIKKIKGGAVSLCEHINKKINEKKLESVIPIIAFPGWNVQGGEKGEPNETIVVCNHEQISGRIEDRIEEPLSEGDVNKICKFLEKATEMDLFDN